MNEAQFRAAVPGGRLQQCGTTNDTKPEPLDAPSVLRAVASRVPYGRGFPGPRSFAITTTSTH